jgi:tetratricopeptide (TPR) repeat protein
LLFVHLYLCFYLLEEALCAFPARFRREEAAQRRAVISVSTRLGTALFRTGQCEEAVVQLQSANEAARGQDDLEGIAEIQSAVADLYLQEKRYDDAYQAAQAALEAAERLADVSLQANVWLVVARIQGESEQLEDATTSYERAIELLQVQQTLSASPASKQLCEVYAHFSDYLERQGESQRAFEMLKLAYRALP